LKANIKNTEEEKFEENISDKNLKEQKLITDEDENRDSLPSFIKVIKSP
jgi:hypothetical protein